MFHVAEMVSVAGLGVHDGITTHRILERDDIELSTEIELRYERVRGSAPHAAVEQLLQAVHLAMTADRVDAYSAAVTYEHDSELDRHVRAALPPRLLADLGVGGNIKPPVARARELYGQRFRSAGDFTFEISGPLELARAKELAVTYLGSLPDDGRRESVRPLEVLSKIADVTVKLDASYSCVLHMYWTTPGTPVGPPDEGLLWSAAVEVLVDGVVAAATRRDDLGYAASLRAYYDCNDPKHVDETAVRARLAEAATRRVTARDVARIREAYAGPQPFGGPDIVRDAKAITAADVARVVAKFQPPHEVLFVREVH
jgi:hypothetical protein